MRVDDTGGEMLDLYFSLTFPVKNDCGQNISHLLDTLRIQEGSAKCFLSLMSFL